MGKVAKGMIAFVIVVILVCISFYFRLRARKELKEIENIFRAHRKSIDKKIDLCYNIIKEREHNE